MKSKKDYHNQQDKKDDFRLTDNLDVAQPVTPSPRLSDEGTYLQIRLRQFNSQRHSSHLVASGGTTSATTASSLEVSAHVAKRSEDYFNYRKPQMNYSKNQIDENCATVKNFYEENGLKFDS